MNTSLIIRMIGKINERATRFLSEELRKKKLNMLSPSHSDILGALFFVENLKMKELPDLTNKDKSTITTLVNKLESCGFIEKRKDENDLRTTRISLSKKGEALKPDLTDISSRLRKKAYNGLTKKERTLLMELLTKIYQNFDR